MRIPFIGGSDEGRSTAWNATRSINLFVETGAQDGKSPAALVGTPGTVVFATFPSGLIRMLHVMVDRCFVVAGADLYELYTDGTFSASLGAFAAPSNTPIVAVDNGVSVNGVGGDQILMLVNGAGYIFDIGTNVLTQISDANFPAGAHQAAFLDGYFIVTAQDMSFHVSEIYNGLTWPALATAAAISTPDNIAKPYGSNQVLYLVKDSVTEVWQDVAIPTSQGCPFSRVAGALLNFGTVADRSVTRCGDTVFMLGTTRVQDSAVYFGVMSVSGTSAQKVSTPAIDYRISHLSSLSDAISYSHVYEGHLFYVLTFPTDDLTLVYDVTTQLWHERSTHIEGFYAQHRHLSNEYAFFGNKHLVSHYSESKIYEMSSAYFDDAGTQIIRIRTAQPLFDPKENDNIKIYKLVIDAETGVGDGSTGHNGSPTAWLSWSNDGGHTWSAEYSASMGKQGEFRTRLVWRRLGSPKNRMFRLKITDAVKVVLLNAIVNDGAIT